LPCHTKAATWLSNAYYAANADQYPEAVAQRLSEYATFWGISSEVEKAATSIKEAAEGHERSLADSDFAIVWGDGPNKERKYPLRNAAEIEKAARWLSRYRNELVFLDKHAIAVKLREKAAALNVPAVLQDELVTRCAGLGYCAAATAKDAWEKRALLSRERHPEYAAAAQQTSEMISDRNFDFIDLGSRIKMAEVMDQFDRTTGLASTYGDDSGLYAPEDTLFIITEKVANDMVNGISQTITGTVYEKTSLAVLDSHTLREWCGDELTDACGGVILDTEKLAELLPTLPRPDAEAFDRMANAIGISVFARQKVAMDAGLTEAELRELAELYQQEAVLP
jgi:hypothetical protein